MKAQKIEGKVYFVGEPGLGQELANEGYEPFGLEHSDIKGLPMPFTVDKSTAAVVVGLDRCVTLSLALFRCRFLSWCVFARSQVCVVLQARVRDGLHPSDPHVPLHRHQPVRPRPLLARLSVLLCRSHVGWVGLRGSDQTFPVDGAIIPGGGSMIHLIECATSKYVNVFMRLLSNYDRLMRCTSRTPEAVVGKPSQDLLNTIVSTYNLDRSRTCMVRPARSLAWQREFVFFHM
jgi:ribonucleotide monophosphatase NagD (HAD superfamily)